MRAVVGLPEKWARLTDSTPRADTLQACAPWSRRKKFCTGAASVARMTLLPLYLRDVVRADADAVGIVFGIEPVYEIPVSLLAGAVVGRLGVERLMLVQFPEILRIVGHAEPEDHG